MRWEQIAEELRLHIQSGQLAPGDRLPSETALAARYAVCRMTAHRVLQELSRQGLVERRRRTGTVVLAREHALPGKVAVLTFAADDFPTIEYLRGLREGLPEQCQILFCDTGEKGEREAEYLKRMAKEADAIVCFPSGESATLRLLTQISQSGQPLVCLDRRPHGVALNTITSDNYAASRRALDLLVQRGHRRIVHITDERLLISSTQERFQAHQQVLLENGVPRPESYVHFFTSFLLPREQYFHHLCQAVERRLEQLFLQAEPPTAIFCLQDAYMAAVIAACRNLEISVPGHLEIVAFNDCPPQFLTLPCPVVRIVQQSRTMGRLAAESLCRQSAVPVADLSAARHEVVPAVIMDWKHTATCTRGTSPETSGAIV